MIVAKYHLGLCQRLHNICSANKENNLKAYNKIIRDNIPNIIRQKGGRCVTRVAESEEAIDYLVLKIIEEAEELRRATNPMDILDELADIQEIINTLSGRFLYYKGRIGRRRISKRRERGGFDNNIILLGATDY